MIEAIVSVLVLIIASSGAGAVCLYFVGLRYSMEGLERITLAFGIGFGLIGWLLFWVGIVGLLTAPIVWALCLIFCLGNILFWRFQLPFHNIELPSIWSKLLLLIAGAVFLIDGLEAISPPIEADTLAYHFNLPRQFVLDEAVSFQPVAFAGAIPMLVHMTYAAAIVMGGEFALTGWVFATSWLLALMLFGISRRWVSDEWALSIAVLFQTLPAIVYGAGTGQVEIRLAIFVLIAVVGLIELKAHGGMKPVILTGLGAGLFLGAKLTGVFFATALGLLILWVSRHRFKATILYGGLILVFGSQWYVWNFIHTGDPLFPMLYKYAEWLGVANPEFWNAAHEQVFREYLTTRGSVVDGVHWILTYPIAATLFPHSQFGSGRIGLGPFVLLATPMALIGIWHLRRRLLDSPLFAVGLLLIGYYLLWFEFGGIPKVRHVLPMAPLLILCLVVPIIRSSLGYLRPPLSIAIGLALIVGLGAQFFYARPLVALHLGSLDKTAFLRQNLMSYPVVETLEKLEGVRKVFLWDRQLQYYINQPTFFASPYGQTLIENAPGNVDSEKFFRQLRSNDITHIVARKLSAPPPAKTADWAIAELAAIGCLTLVASTPYDHFNSRTLQSIWNSKGVLEVWRVSANCRLSN